MIITVCLSARVARQMVVGQEGVSCQQMQMSHSGQEAFAGPSWSNNCSSNGNTYITDDEDQGGLKKG
jgi:hypothetical protein